MGYSKETYQWYKDHGICVKCKREDAEYGRTKCSECLEKEAEKVRAKRLANPKSQKEYTKIRRERLKESGLCVWCGKPLSKYSKCFCVDCRVKNQRNNEKKKTIARSERPSYGMCYRCGERIESGKLCKKCKATSLNNLPNEVPEGFIRATKRMNNIVLAKRG